MLQSMTYVFQWWLATWENIFFVRARIVLKDWKQVKINKINEKCNNFRKCGLENSVDIRKALGKEAVMGIDTVDFDQNTTKLK